MKKWLKMFKSKGKGFLGCVLVVSVIVTIFVFSGITAQAATNVDTFAELKTACQSSGTIVITSAVSCSDTITIPKGVTVYLTCNHDAGSTTQDIARAKGFHDHLFQVNDGATLYIRCCINGGCKDGDGNLRGVAKTGTEGDGYYGRALILNYGHVVLDNDKSVLKNNYNAYNQNYAAGSLWKYDGVTYYGVSTGYSDQTAMPGSAVFCVNGKLTMSNGQIYGCYADNGPAIYACNGYSGDVVKISGGTIKSNVARRYGGAIFAASRKPYSDYENSSSFVGSRTLNSTGSNALLTVSGGKITNNLSRLNSGAVWTGFGATFYMSGGSIYSNVAVEEGGGGVRVNAGNAGTNGGWMCFANPGGEAWIAGGSIYSNTAATNGGGVTVSSLEDGTNKLKISGGSIYKNTAGSNGGGVYCPGDLTMTGGNVYSNTANGDTSKGGGIYLTGASTGKISGGSVYNNKAVDNGGGVSSYGTLTVSGGFFYGNAPYGVSFLKKGTISGGRYGVSAYTGWSEYTVSRNTKAQIHVGSDATLSIAGGTSRVVSALSGDEAIGANVGLLNNGTTTVETSCSSDNGYIDFYGTGTSIQNAGTLSVKGKLQIVSSSKDGQALQYRRGIYNTGTATVSGDLVVRYCSFRAVHNTGTFNMDAGTFYGNEVAANGGAVYNTGIFRMTGGSMYDNAALASGDTKYTGGAIYNTGDDSRFNMSGGSLYNNTSSGMGGAVYYTTSGLTSRISGGSIYNNTAGTHGGAIASYRTNTFYISGGEIYGNTATAGGGGAVFNGGTLDIEDGANIHDNNAGTYGGGVYSSGVNAVITMSGGKIYKNQSTNNGGGIYNGGTADGGGKLSMSGGKVYSNTAGTHAGGVYFTTDGAASTISGGAIYSNTAANGGGVSSYRTNGITLSGVNIYNNTASGTGGGVRSAGKLTISGGLFYGNNAVGVYAADGTLTINGGKFGVSAYTNYSEYTVSRNITSQVTVCEGVTATVNSNSYPRFVSAIDDGASITSNYGILNNGTLTITNASTNSIDFYGTGTSIRNNGTFTVNGEVHIISSAKDGDTTAQARLGIYNSGGTFNFNNANSVVKYCGYRGVNNAGTFNMKGGSISNCACPSVNGGGVYNSGTFNMTAGTISANTADNGDGIYNTSAGTLKMSGAAIVKSGDTVFLAGTTYITVGDFTGDNNIRGYLAGEGFSTGRIVAKYATPASGAGTDALYWNPDAPKMAEQYFSVSGKLLRAGDQGAADETNAISDEDVFISAQYTVSFNGNLSGYTVKVPSSLYKYWNEKISGVSIANATATSAPFTFKGWNSAANGSGTTYSSPLTYTGNSNLTLYAQWDEHTLTVNYYSNYADKSFEGALNAVGSDKNVSVRTVTVKATTAYPDGLYNYSATNASTYLGRTYYTATGKWGTTTTGGKQVHEDTAFDNGMKLAEALGKDISSGSATVNVYAQWTENTLTVNYYSNNADKAFEGALNTVGEGKNVLVRTAPVKATEACPNGLWNYSAEGDSTYLGRTGYTATGNWGTSTSGGVLVHEDEAFATGQALAQALGKDLSNASVTINVCPQWKIITYTIKYDANGGNGAPADQTKTYGKDLTISDTKPTRPGYTFKEWNTDKGGTGTDYQPGDSYTDNKGGTLYAQWDENILTVNYYSNYADKAFEGALNAVGSDKNVLVRTVKVKATTVYPDGLWNYSEAGSSTYLGRSYYTATCDWGTTTSGGTLVHEDTAFETGMALAKALGKDISAENSTINVYAQWTENTLTVNYYSNYADKAFEGALNPVGADKNVMVQTITIPATKPCPNGLSDYTYPSAGTYLGRTYYTATGKWGTTTTGGKLVDEETGFDTAIDFATALGKDISTGSATVNVYPQWKSNTLTVNYYSNYADSSSDMVINPVNGEENVLVMQGVSTMTSDFSNGLWNYIYTSLLLEKKYYTGTGYWNTEIDGTGISVNQETAFESLQEMAEALGVSVADGNATVDVYAQWRANKLRVNYYSNYATEAFAGTLNAVGADKNVVVRTMTFAYDVAQPNGLADYSYTSAATYLGKANYKSEGVWALVDGSHPVHQSTSFANGQEVAVALGADLANGDATVNVYPVWIRMLIVEVDYKGNGATTGSGWTETVDLGTVDTYKFSDNELAFERQEANAAGNDVLFSLEGWTVDNKGKVYGFGAEIPSEDLADMAKSKEGRENKVVTVYAYWDEYPTIEAVDRWFSLEEAKNGKITLKELLRTADAIDGAVGNVTDFDNGEGLFTIVDYNADEFKGFTTTGSTTVTYRAEDKAGNEALRNAVIYIVDKDKISKVKGNPIKRIRFIGAKYYKNSNGSYVSETNGGLNAKSIWINVFEYEKTLTEALNNKRNPSTGKWNKVYHTWTFTKDQVGEVKAYVEEHGLGNSRESDALAKFYEKFKPVGN